MDIYYSTAPRKPMSTFNQVLCALWAEYQRDIPQLSDVNPTGLGVSPERFEVAYKKLGNEYMLPDDPNLCLNDNGLSEARKLIGIAEGFEENGLELALSMANCCGHRLLAKFIERIIKEIDEANKGQLD